MLRRKGTLVSPRRFIFHPLFVFFGSLACALCYALYAALRFPGDGLRGHLSYVAPVVVPFAAFVFDRAERRRHAAAGLAVDSLIVGTAVWRAVGHVPLVSGHALFLSYALLSTRTLVARVTAAVVLLQVVWLKFFVWHDWATASCGIALGSAAALLTRRYKI